MRSSGRTAHEARGLCEMRVERAGAEEEHEHDAHVRVRRAKETKRSGKGNEKSEASVVPMEPGNSPHEDPTREGATVSWNRTRERCRSH